VFASIGFIRVTFLPEKERRNEGRRLGYETLKFYWSRRRGRKKVLHTALVFDDALISLSVSLCIYERTNEEEEGARVSASILRCCCRFLRGGGFKEEEE
jgi:hypothetical protein